MPNRYNERQIPYFGIPGGFIECNPFTIVTQVDLRYRFLRKNYVTLRAGTFADDFTFSDLVRQKPLHTYGVEFARQSLVGPLRIAFQYNAMNGFTGYASVGFDF